MFVIQKPKTLKVLFVVLSLRLLFGALLTSGHEPVPYLCCCVYEYLSLREHTLQCLFCLLWFFLHWYLLLSPQLVLRKWSELIPGGEFRCFVKENKLIGENQRLWALLLTWASTHCFKILVTSHWNGLKPFKQWCNDVAAAHTFSRLF